MNSNKNQQVMVSVLCTVFNHEKYLRKCLEGFVGQETNFRFEIIIHDDKSTDLSKLIIEEYVKAYPYLFIPIYQSENQYSKNKSIIEEFMLPLASGKYIAFCEGDDFWCNNKKLQLQYNYMKSNPECSICLHNSIVHDLSNQHKDKKINSWGKIHIMSAKEVFFGWLVHTSSYFVRKEYAQKPDFAFHYWSGDYVRLTWAYAFGNAVVLPEIMSVYNLGNASGATVLNINSSIEKLVKLIRERENYLIKYNEVTDHKFTNVIHERLIEINFDIIITEQGRKMKETHDIKLMAEAAREVTVNPYFKEYLKDKSIIDRIKILLKYNWYPLYYLIKR